MLFIDVEDGSFNGIKHIGFFSQVVSVTYCGSPRLVDHEKCVFGNDHSVACQCDYGSDRGGNTVHMHGLIAVVTFENVIDSDTGKHRTATRIDEDIEVFALMLFQQILYVIGVLVFVCPCTPRITDNITVEIDFSGIRAEILDFDNFVDVILDLRHFNHPFPFGIGFDLSP